MFGESCIEVNECAQIICRSDKEVGCVELGIGLGEQLCVCGVGIKLNLNRFKRVLNEGLISESPVCDGGGLYGVARVIAYQGCVGAIVIDSAFSCAAIIIGVAVALNVVCAYVKSVYRVDKRTVKFLI